MFFTLNYFLLGYLDSAYIVDHEKLQIAQIIHLKMRHYEFNKY